MYKILVVDDDVFFRHEITHYFDWQKEGFEMAGEAMDGVVALKVTEENRPDLILTDISMPEMNGVELIREVKKRWPEIVVIVLSSYDDFRFVKDAMKLGASDYLLKYEMDEQSLKEMLANVRKVISGNTRKKQEDELITSNLSVISGNKLKKSILEEEALGEREDVEFLNHVQNVTLADFCIQGLPEGEMFGICAQIREKLTGRETAAVMDDENIAFLLILENESSTMRVFEYVTGKLTEIFNALLDSGIRNFTIGVSENVMRADNLARLYEEAVFAQEQSIYEGYEKIYFFAMVKTGDTDSLPLEDRVGLILDDIREGQLDTGRKKLERVMNEIEKQRPRKKELYQIVRRMFNLLYQAAIEEKIAPERVIGEPIVTLEWCRQFRTVNAMRTAIFSAYDAFAEIIEEREHKFTHTNQKQIEDIINYIQKNYMKELSLDVLSAEFNLTPNYLCKIFRKNTGMKLTNYINQVRIAGAVKLLKNTNMKAKDIAETVGFSSAAYFSTVFKQVTGQTLTVYKNQ